MNKFHINNCTASDGFIMQRMEIINSSEQLYRVQTAGGNFDLDCVIIWAGTLMFEI